MGPFERLGERLARASSELHFTHGCHNFFFQPCQLYRGSSPTEHERNIQHNTMATEGKAPVARPVQTLPEVEPHDVESQGYLKSFEKTLIKYNIEARGIQRVLPEDRQPLNKRGLLQIYLLWFSINLAAVNITLGMLGPAVFFLSFRDAALCAVFGMILGSLPVAYIATFGPRSGNRTMVFARYVMGWYPSKLVVILNIIVLLGYALINAVVAGQIISAVSVNGNLSVIVGIVVVAIITWVITTFGYSIFHLYERYAWFPQLVVLCILYGVAGPRFDLETDPLAEEGADYGTVVGSRLSFFSLCLAAAITYSGGAADYFVYYPEETPRWKVFTVTMLGLTTSFTFAFLTGIGLASGFAKNESWGTAYGVSQGALIVEGFGSLGGFGSFCSVVVALGIIANLIPTTYSAGVDFQTLGRYLERVPRIVWNTIAAVIYTVCAIAGRENLAVIFTNFLALMGYWVSIWIAIVLEEHLIFRRKLGWNWDAWSDKRKLPLGIAALIAFLIGWVGAVLCMAQVYYIGPIAALVGDYGADMGTYVGFAWAALFYAPLRALELRYFKR